MATSINNFRNNFQGTRPNRFRISIDLPTGAQIDKLDLYGKATQVPTASMGVIPVPWMGRVIKFSGERTFSDWTVQLYDANDNSNDVRYQMMEWLNYMDTVKTHDVSYNVTSTATVAWNDFGGGQVGVHSDQQNWSRSIALYNVFPIDIGPLELSYDLQDTFSEFAVTFAYDYWDYVSPSPIDPTTE